VAIWPLLARQNLVVMPGLRINRDVRSMRDLVLRHRLLGLSLRLGSLGCQLSRTPLKLRVLLFPLLPQQCPVHLGVRCFRLADLRSSQVWVLPRGERGWGLIALDLWLPAPLIGGGGGGGLKYPSSSADDCW
jgi:hypothetical protein